MVTNLLDTSGPPFRRTPAAVGTVILLLGFLLAAVVLTVRLNADWGHLGSVIARNPVLCWGMSIALMLGGVALIKQASHDATDWAPAVPGPRFERAVLYTRSDCPLCDEAVRTLKPYRSYLPEIAIADVDNDSSLKEKFGTCVPVLEFDGRVRFRGHVNETLLRRLIEGSPPV